MPRRLQEGLLYNAEDGRKALRDVFALGLFDNVQVFPKQNARDEAKVRGGRASTSVRSMPLEHCPRIAYVGWAVWHMG